jgi:hypothetical protein
MRARLPSCVYDPTRPIRPLKASTGGMRPWRGRAGVDQGEGLQAYDVTVKRAVTPRTRGGAGQRQNALRLSQSRHDDRGDALFRAGGKCCVPILGKGANGMTVSAAWPTAAYRVGSVSLFAVPARGCRVAVGLRAVLRQIRTEASCIAARFGHRSREPSPPTGLETFEPTRALDASDCLLPAGRSITVQSLRFKVRSS